MKRPVVAFVVVATFAAAVATSGGVAGATATANNTTTNDTADGERFGTAISTFMASSAANANGTVDQEMWEAAVTRSTTANASVAARVQTLQERLDTLSERRQELLAAYRNGTIPEIAFEVRMAHLTARIQQLADAANSTAVVAHTRNVTPPGLNELVRNATQVAATVRGPPADVPRGPPNATPGNGNGQGPPENRTTEPENRTTGPGAGTSNGNDQGPPENRTGGPENRTTGPENAPMGNGPAGNGTEAGGNGPAGNGTEAGGNGPSGQNGGRNGPPNGQSSANDSSVRVSTKGVTLLNARR